MQKPGPGGLFPMLFLVAVKINVVTDKIHEEAKNKQLFRQSFSINSRERI
jgi:hypothetical protein